MLERREAFPAFGRAESWIEGRRWVDYARPRDLVEPSPAARRRPRRGPLPDTARFAVVSQVAPALTEALTFAEKVRAGLLRRSDGAPVFVGRGDGDEPLSGHRHAFVLPEANGRDGRITHLTIHAPMGFDDEARSGLEELRKVWSRDDYEVRLVLLGLGRREDFAGVNRTAGQCPLVAEATEWVSRTPFVPTRHPKTSRSGEPKLDERGLQVGSPEHDLRRLLAAAGLPEPVAVAPVGATPLGGKPTPWLSFRTWRERGGGKRGAAAGCGFRLVFATPVRGPIALGFGAHLGLGHFIPRGAQEGK